MLQMLIYFPISGHNGPVANPEGCDLLEGFDGTSFTHLFCIGRTCNDDYLKYSTQLGP